MLEPGIQGSKIILEGAVRSTKCKPVQGALVDFWQADGSGAYDNAGYRLRGHQFADGAGRYRLETVVPGVYPGRTRHFHVRVQAPNRPALTTQLYFPGEPENKRDFIFNAKLVLALGSSAGAKTANFGARSLEMSVDLHNVTNTNTYWDARNLGGTINLRQNGDPNGAINTVPQFGSPSQVYGPRNIRFNVAFRF